MENKQGREDYMDAVFEKKVTIGENVIVEETGKITQKGQVTIPIEIRSKMNIEEGDRLKFIYNKDGKLNVEVIKQKKLSELYGILGKPPKNANLPIEEAVRLAREHMIEEWSNDDETGD